VTTSRTLWVIFCCAMAAGWALCAFLLWFTLIVPLLAVMFVPGSLLAILIPVGTPPKPAQFWPAGRWPGHSPSFPCSVCGMSFEAHARNNGWCPPGRPAQLPAGGGWR